MKKISIDQYPKDTAPVVLLWNDKWANPVVGKWHGDDHRTKGTIFERSTSNRFYSVNIRGGSLNSDVIGSPTHFSYLQEEG